MIFYGDLLEIVCVFLSNCESWNRRPSFSFRVAVVVLYSYKDDYYKILLWEPGGFAGLWIVLTDLTIFALLVHRLFSPADLHNLPEDWREPDVCLWGTNGLFYQEHFNSNQNWAPLPLSSEVMPFLLPVRRFMGLYCLNRTMMVRGAESSLLKWGVINAFFFLFFF